MSNENIANVSKEFIKAYAKGAGMENDDMVDSISNIASAIINPEGSKKDSPSPFSGLASVFSGLDLGETPSTTTTKSETNNSPYQLVNNFYGLIWNSNDLSQLENYYTNDALHSFVSTIEENHQWNMTSKNKIVEYYKQLWLPYVKNTNTMIYKFNFSVDEEKENETHCTVEYTITQSELNTKTMKWSKYHISMTDKIVMVKDNEKYLISSFNGILSKKDLLEEESQF